MPLLPKTPNADAVWPEFWGKFPSNNVSPEIRAFFDERLQRIDRELSVAIRERDGQRADKFNLIAKLEAANLGEHGEPGDLKISAIIDSFTRGEVTDAPAP